MTKLMNEQIRALKSPQAVPPLFNAIDRASVELARRALEKHGADDARLKLARTQAQQLVDAARKQAAAKRSAKHQKDVQVFRSELLAVRERLQAQMKQRSMRSPSEVVAQFMERVQPAAKEVTQNDRASLLVRGFHGVSGADVSKTLRSALGLKSAAESKARHVVIRQVLPARNGRGPLLAVRFPLRRASCARELHCLAWALRSMRSFAGVRVDGTLKLLYAPKPPVSAAQRAERAFAWPLILTRTLQAHTLAPAAGGQSLGGGIIVAHPDTGWAPHPQLNNAQLDLQNSFNIGTGVRVGRAARFDTTYGSASLLNVTHGLATGSVIIGGANAQPTLSQIDDPALSFESPPVVDPQGSIVGVAPRALLRPIKFIDDGYVDVDRTGVNGAGVVRVFDEDLITALDYARSSGSHVVSLSIGGLMHDEVRQALDAAIEGDEKLIVVAAAGQTYTGEALSSGLEWVAGIGVGDGDTVILPAAYANVIAVAGCSPDGRPWLESHRGPNVDITAPADAVWVAELDHEANNPPANRNRTPTLECGSGTSFAAAFMAGVAALWLSHHGRANLLDRYKDPSVPLAWVFRDLLQRTSDAAHAADWDTQRYGPGLVNVEALLTAPLPAARDVPRPPATVSNILTEISAWYETDAGRAIGDGFGVLWDLVPNVVDAVASTGRAAWAALVAGASAVIDFGRSAITTLIAAADLVGSTMAATFQAAVDGLVGLVTAAADVVEDVLAIAADAGADAAEAVASTVETALDQAREAGETVWDWLTEPWV